jgi:L-rhamnonate dehydratase
MEECLIPEDLDGHISLRQRLPWQTLATGEHWYTQVPFQWAIRHGVVDILQPDMSWCGGMTTCRKIASAAEAAGVSVILHCGGNTPYGQHFTYATPSSPWCEFFVGTPPGVPLGEAWRLPGQGVGDQDRHLAVGGGALEEVSRLPGQAIPSDGWLVPSDAPGFGLDVEEDWLVPL